MTTMEGLRVNMKSEATNTYNRCADAECQQRSIATVAKVSLIALTVSSIIWQILLQDMKHFTEFHDNKLGFYVILLPAYLLKSLNSVIFGQTNIQDMTGHYFFHQRIYFRMSLFHRDLRSTPCTLRCILFISFIFSLLPFNSIVLKVTSKHGELL